MSKKEKLEKKMQDNDAAIRKLVVELTGLRSLAHYDPKYSEAKVHNLGVDLSQLEEKQDKLINEYHDYLASDEYRLAARQQVEQLTGMLNDLNAGAAELKTRLFELRNAAPAKIIAGDDPTALAVEIIAVREQMDIVSEALAQVKQAFRLVKRPPQVDAPRELVKGEAVRYRDWLG